MLFFMVYNIILFFLVFLIFGAGCFLTEFLYFFILSIFFGFFDISF